MSENETSEFEQRYNAVMTKLVESSAQAKEQARFLNELNKETSLPINMVGAFSYEEFDLSGSTGPDLTVSGGLSLALQGHKLIFLREGSSSGARIDVDIGGSVLQMAPGDELTGTFNNVRFARSSSSVTVGNARFCIVKHPQADFREYSAINRSGALSRLASAQNAAATNNTPSGATAGISIAGAKGVRVIISADNGQTLTMTGTIRFWFYDPVIARWVLTPELNVDLSTIGAAGATFRDICLPDRQIAVWAGRMFVEANNVAVSSGAVTIHHLVWDA